jgi:hypothetical protein
MTPASGFYFLALDRGLEKAEQENACNTECCGFHEESKSGTPTGANPSGVDTSNPYSLLKI